jgi:hypothetical protein
VIDWTHGSWTGSLNAWANREVRDHLKANPIARRVRYSTPHRAVRCFFDIGTFHRFIWLYFVVNMTFVVIEALVASFTPEWLPAWTAWSPGQPLDTKALILNVSSYLVSTQVGLLGVISLALALVTLIAQREGSSTDVQLYYHESQALEVVASCAALLTILCVQLLWPLQFFIHQMGLGTGFQFFKLCLLQIHIFWLVLNLSALAYFVATTFRFVQQQERELLRERYTAHVAQPRELKQRLRQQLFTLGVAGLTDIEEDDGKPTAFLGGDFKGPSETEIRSMFDKPVALYDVRMRWVRWILRRWMARCIGETVNSKPHALHGLGQQAPLIWFTPHLDVSQQGSISWCQRRGGVPLTQFEKFILRQAFRFRRVDDDA